MKKVKFIGYKSRHNKKWYWKLVAANGEKIAGGVESFRKKPGQKELDMLKRNILNAVLG